MLVGGYLVAVSGEVIADQSDMGQSILGASLVALATRLPGLSTTYSAVRLGACRMAASNVLGAHRRVCLAGLAVF
ncbi:hypothetical protein Pla52o_06180 [Novipirellula galeiformis]|uniref:Sodium/calcium exchanger membrane region domain-containing protein n=1 Tax=Novipirellula galeiformis TaxID=2528004 RepID=A0A5C6CP58_9BACT|nr:hypothetical protein Pla52o_06180 [Novipirellula galeiformis]